jgi:hypothetical protein
MSTSVYTGLNPFNFIRKHFLHISVRKVAVHLLKVLEVRNDFDALCSRESEMSINFLSLISDGLPLRSPSNTQPVSLNFSISLRTAFR